VVTGTEIVDRKVKKADAAALETYSPTKKNSATKKSRISWIPTGLRELPRRRPTGLNGSLLLSTMKGVWKDSGSKENEKKIDNVATRLQV